MIKKYLFRQFIGSFLSIFLTLFLVSSIIVLFQIAKITSYIELSLYELFKLYSLMSVKLILFTIPISFFITCFMCVLRLSKENEIIMLFSLGYSPRKISNFFSILALFVSSILLIISIVFMPLSFSLYDNFIDYKRAFSKINLKNNNFGQKIGDYIYFSDELNDGLYKNIVLYKYKNEEQILLAQSGIIINEDNKITFKLKDVTLYSFGLKTQISKVKNLNFSTLINAKISNLQSFKDYWKDYKNPSKSKELVLYVLLSLLPIASVHFALAFSIISSRYEKSHEYLAMFVFLIIYFVPMMLFLNYHFYTIAFVFFASLFISKFFFRKQILSRY